MKSINAISLLRRLPLWLIIGGAILLFYFFFDPVSSGWMPQCLFYKLTGLQCMGCGAQRMIHALLHGNFREAMEANYLLFFSLPFLAFLVWVEYSRKSHPLLYKRIHSLPVLISIPVVLIFWLILRNLLAI